MPGRVARIATAMAVMVLSACQAEGQGTMPLGAVGVTGRDGVERVVAVEIADTDAARAQGLMHRVALDEDAGMYFVWPQAGRNVFWMKNTLVGLDMLFIRDGRVVAVAPDAEPMDETPVDPGVDSDAVLEVNAGWSERNGVGVGSAVRRLR